MLRKPQGLAAPARAGSAGFTLIELMIAVVILAVLVTVALPSFQQQLFKGRRSDALVALMDASNRQQQLMLDRSTFTTDMTALGYAADPMISPEGFYSVAVSTPKPPCSEGISNCFVLTATPLSSSVQSKDIACAKFVLDSLGTRSATNSSDADTTGECW